MLTSILKLADRGILLLEHEIEQPDAAATRVEWEGVAQGRMGLVPIVTVFVRFWWMYSRRTI
jgi:hypothetical protein